MKIYLLDCFATYFIEHAPESGEQVPGACDAVGVVTLDALGRAHWPRDRSAAHQRERQYKHSSRA